jgi:antagonist of KipI
VSLRVRDPGLVSVLVDRGRTHARHLGVPLGGAADRAALALGNGLVGNPPDAVALEVTLAGPTVEALHPVACVVFGAPFRSTINDRPIPAGVTFTLEAGDVLRVGGTSEGVRGYLCVAGGFDAPEVLGSRSALEPLKPDDVLACRPSRTEPRGLGFVASHPVADAPGSPHVLRALDGPQRDWFADDSFFAQLFEVSPASNRMGLRLKGLLLPRRPGELVSEAVAPGTVQVTNDGLPVVLGVDGQTIGGYPKVAHVARADLDVLAQLRPGERVRFVRVTPAEAATAAAERAAFLADWLTRLRIAERRPVFV